MMKKKITVLGMVGLLVIQMLSGCGISTSQASVNSTKKDVVNMESQSVGLIGVGNARQLGGYTGADGKKVKRNILLRSGKLFAATGEDIQALEDTYNLTKIIDFRTTPERVAEPDPVMEQVRNRFILLLDETEDNSANAVTAAYSQDPVQALIDYARNGHVEDMYVDMITDEWSQKGFTQFFQEVLNHEEGAILWHCTGGKDRAGLASVLLLSALGVEEDTILADFELSNDFYQSNIEQMEQAVREKGCTDEEVEAVKSLIGVNKTYMKRALDTIDETYGSMHQYLNNQLQVSEQDIKILREKYLE